MSLIKFIEKNQYAIQSNNTGKVIFSTTGHWPNVGVVDENGDYGNSWFFFEAGTDHRAGTFRLRCYATDTVIFSRNDNEPIWFGPEALGIKTTLTNFPADNGVVSDDQYFAYVFEDTEISRIVYSTDQAKVLYNTPDFIGSEVNSNNSDINQTMSFTFSQTETIASTYEYTLGFTIMVGAKVSVGIPLIVDGEVTTQVSDAQTWKWGVTTTESKTVAESFPVTALPHSQVTATARVTHASFEVPFTIYSKSIKTGYEVETKGKYTGVTYYDVRCDFTQEAL